MFKKIVFGFLQVLASTLVFVLILEAGFWASGFPRGAARYIETISIREKLSTRKPKGEIRIFAYGESTMHGSHYWPASNPARWMEAWLNDFLPEKKIRVVNFSRMGQGAGFIYRSFRDTAGYKPDLAIFYLGHNSFLPDNRKWEVEAEEKKISSRLEEFFRASRFISAVYRQVIAIRIRTKKNLPEDRIEHDRIETPLGSPLGPENAVLRTDPRYAENIAFFKGQVEKILKLARKRKIPVIFFDPVGNLKDFAPYASAHMKNLSEKELAEWNSFFQQGMKAKAESNWAAATDFFSRAYALDNTWAELSFRFGEVRFLTGEIAEARRLFMEARDNDTIVVRATRETGEALRDLQKSYNFSLLDTEKILVSESFGGILGEPVVEDNVHFSVRGHALMGRALADEVYRRGWIAPQPEWHFDKARSFEEIAGQLGVTPDLLFFADIKMVHYFGSRVENRVRFAKKALEIRPDDPVALRQLAWTYWWMNKRKQALEIYQKLALKSPESLQEVFTNQPEIQTAFKN